MTIEKLDIKILPNARQFIWTVDVHRKVYPVFLQLFNEFKGNLKTNHIKDMLPTMELVNERDHQFSIKLDDMELTFTYQSKIYDLKFCGLISCHLKTSIEPEQKFIESILFDSRGLALDFQFEHNEPLYIGYEGGQSDFFLHCVHKAFSA